VTAPAQGMRTVDDEDVELSGGRTGLGRNLHLLPRALHYLRPYRKESGASVGLTVVSAALVLAEPLPLAFIVDTVLAQRDPPGWVQSLVPGDGSAVSYIIFGVIASLLITALGGSVQIANEYLTTTVDQRMVLDFRSDLFRHAQRLSFSFHDDNRTGMLMYRINNQADKVGQIVIALPTFAQSFLTLVGMLYISARIDPYLALLALTVIPLVWYSTKYYAHRIEPQLMTVRRMEGTNLSLVHEAMAMLRVVVTFGRERHEYERFRAQGEETVDVRIKLTVKQAAFQLAVNFMTALGAAAVLGVGAYLVLTGRITPGDLLIVIAYIAAVYAPLEAMTNSVTNFQEQLIGFSHALSLLDTPREIEERPDAKPLTDVRGEISFDEVAFGYAGRLETLRDISFDLEAGKSLAVVGPTGAGKSTLVSLIPRLYDPQQGRVLIDGVDVRDVTLESLRQQFSVVLQEPLLFSGTIGENIAYGRLGATHDEIRDAARAANAHDFIKRLPQRYKTKLGERGAKLSGGERQRIAIARAFLRDAPILILDEPTSAVDSETESGILEALRRLMAGRTTVMIAHRLSTTRNADMILVLDHGEVVERGRHDDLLAADGLYRRLWEAQTKSSATAEPPIEALGAPLEPPKDPDADEGAPGATAGSNGRAAATAPAPTDGTDRRKRPRRTGDRRTLPRPPIEKRSRVDATANGGRTRRPRRRAGTP
jgi:ATP-binding cassette, subfamily B, bacterial